MKSRAHLEAELARRLPDATIEFLGYTTDRGARANYKLTRSR
jgi:hypothetical protein